MVVAELITIILSLTIFGGLMGVTQHVHSTGTYWYIGMAASLRDKPRKSQLSLKRKLSLPVNVVQGRYRGSSRNPGNRQQLSEIQDDEQGELSLR